MTEKIIIIGGGPAGLAAAIYTARANLQPLLFAGSPPGGQLTLTSDVENFPGFESVLGPELIRKMRAHAQKFGTRIQDANILKVDFSKQPFTLSTHDASYTAQSVLIATGAKALWLGLENEQRLRGKGVSACATCDGFFFKNKVVAVVGGGDTAAEEALTLTHFATKVYLLHRRKELRASKIMQDRVLHHPKIEPIWSCQLVDVLGDNKVEGIRLAINDAELKEAHQDLVPHKDNTYDLKLDGLFIAIGHKPDTDLFKGQLEQDEKGYLLTSGKVAFEHFRKKQQSGYPLEKFNFDFQSATSIPGVFAAGDNVDHEYRQAATATGMGVAAALETERWLG